MKLIKSIYFATKPLPEILFIFLLCTYLYISYTAPKHIYYNYEGIMYEEKSEATEPIRVIIDGEYKKSLFGDADEFIGLIKLGNENLYFLDWTLMFKKYKMAPFVGQNMHADIYTNDVFKKMTIEKFMSDKNGVYTNYGCYISAPCKTRQEAIKITKELIKRPGF